MFFLQNCISLHTWGNPCNWVKILDCCRLATPANPRLSDTVGDWRVLALRTWSIRQRAGPSFVVSDYPAGI